MDIQAGLIKLLYQQKKNTMIKNLKYFDFTWKPSTILIINLLRCLGQQSDI